MKGGCCDWGAKMCTLQDVYAAECVRRERTKNVVDNVGAVHPNTVECSTFPVECFSAREI